MSESVGMKFAILALKGNRFEEAEQWFTSLIEESGGPQAWVGLGCAKLGQLIEGRTTVEEIVSCFTMAREACATAADRENVEKIAVTRTLAVVETLIERRAELLARVAKIQEKAAIAAAATGASVLFGTSSKKIFGTLASYNVFDRGVDGLQSTYRDAESLQSDIQRIESTIRSLAAFPPAFALHPKASYLLTMNILMAQAGLPRPVMPLPERPTLKGSWNEDWRTLDDIVGGDVIAHAEGPWQINMQNQIYGAPDFDTLAGWVSERRVPTTATVCHPVVLRVWTRVDEVEPLRDAAGLTPKKGLLLLTCRHCGQTGAYEASAMSFRVGVATVECRSCRGPFSVQQNAIKPEHRVWRAKAALRMTEGAKAAD